MLRRHPREHGGDMVCVVTTVKDTQENLDRFVDRNLSAGADHLFMYVDDADEATHRRLSANPHVTAVRTGAGYWHGQRPQSLNKRQWVNANLTNLLLTGFPEVGWLFHLDGDESLDLDRGRLSALPSEVRAVRLRTLESVASAAHWSSGPPRSFKRPLEEGELALLTTLGALARPDNKAYFHGHTAGKSGLRPTADLRLGVHDVKSLDLEKLPAHHDEALNVLHYDSFSPEEFLRKWSEHLRADNLASFRNRKERLRAALATLAGTQMPEGRKRELVMQIYRRYVADDVELLDDLGLLVHPRPDRHRHRPRRFGRQARKDLEALLRGGRELDKSQWFDKWDYAPARTLAALADRVGSRSVQERLSASRA